jgi:hypothetical protein
MNNYSVIILKVIQNDGSLLHASGILGMIAGGVGSQANGVLICFIRLILWAYT